MRTPRSALALAALDRLVRGRRNGLTVIDPDRDDHVTEPLPFELRLKDFEIAMQDVFDFFYDVNVLFQNKGLPRLDDERRPAPARALQLEPVRFGGDCRVAPLSVRKSLISRPVYGFRTYT